MTRQRDFFLLHWVKTVSSLSPLLFSLGDKKKGLLKKVSRLGVTIKRNLRDGECKNLYYDNLLGLLSQMFGPYWDRRTIELQFHYTLIEVS